MINVSNEFLTTMEKRRNFTGYAEVTFSDGNTLVLTEEDFTVSNNSIVDAAGANGIPLGVAVCKTVQIEIANPNDKYSDYDFFGAKILYKLRFKLGETTESFNIGEFTVLDPQTYGETIIITALDNMYKANDYYSTKLVFPATIGEILRDVCSTCGIPLGTTSFMNDDFVIEKRPEGNYIARNLIGYIAMIAGGNARINRNGYLEIISYDFSINDVLFSGGNFKAWTETDTISGGSINPWSEGDELSGGELNERLPYHVFRKFKNLKVDTDSVVITGVQMERQVEEETETLVNGLPGYILEVENPLVSGKEEAFLELLGNALIGGEMRRFEGDHLAYPLAEFMDPCLVIDRKGNVYPTILTDINFEFFGFTTIKNSAESPESTRLRYTPAEVNAIKVAKKLVEKEKTEREQAIENLNKLLGDSSGMYSTDVNQDDGSAIRYFHDKPTLDESQNVIKITSEAIGFSQDGGETYPYGVTLNGETVTRLLYAEGINANYIKTGSLVISDSSGNVLLSANINNGAVVIAGFNVSDRAIYNGTKSLEDETHGVYLGIDGFKIVGLRGYQKVENGGTTYGGLIWDDVLYEDTVGVDAGGMYLDAMIDDDGNGVCPIIWFYNNDEQKAYIDYTGIYNDVSEILLSFDGTANLKKIYLNERELNSNDSWELGRVGDSYESLNLNGLKFHDKYLYPDAFPNQTFLIIMNGVTNPSYASMYTVVFGDAGSGTTTVARLSRDIDIYPRVGTTTSGYAYGCWIGGSGYTDRIVAKIIKLA